MRADILLKLQPSNSYPENFNSERMKIHFISFIVNLICQTTCERPLQFWVVTLKIKCLSFLVSSQKPMVLDPGGMSKSSLFPRCGTTLLN